MFKRNRCFVQASKHDPKSIAHIFQASRVFFVVFPCMHCLPMSIFGKCYHLSVKHQGASLELLVNSCLGPCRFIFLTEAIRTLVSFSSDIPCCHSRSLIAGRRRPGATLNFLAQKYVARDHAREDDVELGRDSFIRCRKTRVASCPEL